MINLNLLFRSIHRQKLNNIVIIISLAVGLACIILISTFINRELSTDSFHKDHKRMYALQCDDPWTENGKMNHCRDGSAEYMKNNISQVEDFCRINNINIKKIVAYNEAYFDKPLVIAVSRNFFSFFNYTLLTTNSNSALKANNSLVISKELAVKYFGIADPIGKNIILTSRDKEEEMVVTGIFEKPQENTQLKFDMIRPMQSGDSRCYIKLKPNTDVTEVENLLTENSEKIPSIHDGAPGQYYLQPLIESYFDTTRRSAMEASRDKMDLLIALIIGIVIVVVALFNYFGLLNISLIEKTKSLTIQRINGSSKTNIAIKFLVENTLLFVISFLLSLLLIYWAAPFFSKISNTNISLNYIFQPKQLLVLFECIVVFLLATFLFISFRIKSALNTNMMRPSFNQTNKRTQLPAFNIFQLASSIVLIVCSIIILNQIKYISEKPIGMDKSVIEVKIPAQHADKTNVLKNELLNHPVINSISTANASPVLEHYMLLLHYDENGKDKTYAPSVFPGDEKFISTLGIEIMEGEGFFAEEPSANKNKCIINESLAKLFTGQKLIGKPLPGNHSNIVVGIVKDFHYSNLKHVVEPAYIGYSAGGNHLLVKPMENQVQQARELIAEAWEKHIPDYPLNIESIGDRYEWMHRENQNYILLVGSCCFISIFLSMIGLFVISWRSCSYRTKEIGVRKVNGAKINEILATLNKDFLTWVFIAFVIACPIAWYAMNQWLSNFAYKTIINWWVFAMAGGISLVVALITVSFQSWRAASRNPVEALRYE